MCVGGNKCFVQRVQTCLVSCLVKTSIPPVGCVQFSYVTLVVDEDRLKPMVLQYRWQSPQLFSRVGVYWLVFKGVDMFRFQILLSSWNLSSWNLFSLLFSDKFNLAAYTSLLCEIEVTELMHVIWWFWVLLLVCLTTCSGLYVPSSWLVLPTF